ncbi:hypothetical protein MN608_00187 [Microdochium nivale]|nr:hypothetical protein MN608_00187 [Microdochium nivale]
MPYESCLLSRCQDTIQILPARQKTESKCGRVETALRASVHFLGHGTQVVAAAAANNSRREPRRWTWECEIAGVRCGRERKCGHGRSEGLGFSHGKKKIKSAAPLDFFCAVDTTPTSETLWGVGQ